MSGAARLVWHPGYLAYDFGPQHPLRPERLRLTLDLMQASGVLPPEGEIVRPGPATDEELAWVHAPDYVRAVQRLGADLELAGVDAARYGFGYGDNPVFPGMHDAMALIAGGSLTGARLIMRGQADHAFNHGGGLHHALRDRASGFCIYNDPALAIAAFSRERGWRTLYLDFDVHHGDGVQWLFYDDPRVLTCSFHETGRYLFPGTGDVFELGEGAGRGYSVNVPLEPYTEDGSWLEAVEALVPLLCERFRPDVIVSQHGCDAHAWDPLAHLLLTTNALAEAARLVHRLAHEFCAGRWLALGGGGYDIYRVVPRAWTLVWAELSGQPLPAELPGGWRAAVERRAERPFPAAFRDDPTWFPPAPRRAAIEAANRQTVGLVRELAVPKLLRLAYPAARSDAPGVVPGLARDMGRVPEARTRAVELPQGLVFLRDWCPPSFLRSLKPDPGLSAFARDPEREHELLVRLAERPQGMVAVAHTPAGVIVGQVSVAKGEDWWEGIPGLYEVAVEVSRNWRRSGLAKRLLAFTLEPDEFEELILIATGYSWHWDLSGTGLDDDQYRDLVQRLFASVGFSVAQSNEPNLALRPQNILLVRIGRRVSRSPGRRRMLNSLRVRIRQPSSRCPPW